MTEEPEEEEDDGQGGWACGCGCGNASFDCVQNYVNESEEQE